MKRNIGLTIGILMIFCATATVSYAQPDPPRPKILLRSQAQVTQTIRKANNIVAKSQEAQLKRNQLLSQLGQKTIRQQGKAIVTTASPVPDNELALLRPMVPILSLDNLNSVMSELVSIQQNLNNFLIDAQVNMTNQMLQQLNPQNAQQLLNQVNQTIADLTGVSTVVDTIEDFFDSFGW